jgi:peptide/nickel transport system substrate-binding protein
VAAVVCATALLSACTPQPQVVKHSTATVGIAQPFTSYNPQTSYGDSAVNEQISYATNAQFVYYDNDSRLIPDTSFGTVREVSASPLKVKYTVNTGVKWSDGVRVSRADLLLAWAANSGALNTAGFDPRGYLASDGRFTKSLPAGVVWFDGRTTGGLQYAKSRPTLGSDGRSLTLNYDQFYVDWKTAFEIGLPAHIVAEKAFGLASATKADAALVTAILTGDTAKLAKLARVWNTAFTLRAGKLDPALLVGDGPYTVSGVDAEGSVTLTANPRYTGDHRPRIETITARVLSTTQRQIDALRSGAADIITPRATAATAQALVNLPKITIQSGYDASFEHLDLQFSHSRDGSFDDPLVRQAFLKVVPRQKIVDQVAGTIQEEAAPRSSFMLFPGTSAYTAAVADNGSKAYATVDVAAARGLLARAHDPHPVVCVLYDPTNAIRVAEFSLIRDSAKQAGFRVTDCSSPGWASELGKPGAYDASIFGWRSTTSAVTEPTARLHSGVSSENYNFYASPVTDALLDTLSHTTDAAGQTQLLTEIDRQLFTDGYGLPLFQLPSLTAFRTTVAGIRPSPFAPGVFWNIWEWRPTR